jgi:uncharacterized protein
MGDSQISGDPGDVVWVSGLGQDTCWRLIEAAPLGRVAFVRDGRPTVLPVNHAIDGRTVVFRTDRRTGLGALVAHQPVAFEVDDGDAAHQTGWSVLVTGDVERVDAHGRRRIPPPGPQPWAPGDRDDWIRIVPVTVTGRSISRRRRQPDGTFLPYMPPD